MPNIGTCLYLAMIAGLLACIGCSSIEHACIYRPMGEDHGDWHPNELNAENASFVAEDGTRLHGWFLPCPESKSVILFAHGRSGNVTTLTKQLREFCDLHRVAVMVFDYRGYGKSEGTPSELGLYQDARAARDWLSKRTGLQPRQIILMGRSLGAAVAVELASTDGAAGLILESPFASIPELAHDQIPYLIRPRSRFNSKSKIADYHGPLLISHGDKDRLIPFQHAIKLYECANEPKTFVRNAGAGHTDRQCEEYHRVLDRFLARIESSSVAPAGKFTGKRAILQSLSASKTSASKNVAFRAEKLTSPGKTQ